MEWKRARRKLLLSLAVVTALGLTTVAMVQAAPDSGASRDLISAPAAPEASASPASQPAAGVTAPSEVKDLNGALETLKTTIAEGKAGHWWYMSSLICLLIMFGLKVAGVFAKIGRWKYIILPTLSIAAALLAAFQGGVSLSTAVGVFSSSWATGMLEELWNHGILKKPHNS